MLKRRANVRGFDKGKHVKIDRSESVGERHGGDIAVIDRGEMDAVFHQSGIDGQPLRGIVVAADHQNFHIFPVETPPGETGKEVAKQLYGLGAGDGFVVYVSGNQDRVGLFRVQNIENLLENVRLIFQHTELIEPFAQMEIRQMEQFHSSHRLFCP